MSYMRSKILLLVSILLAVSCLIDVSAEYSNRRYRREGVHSGNKVRTTFYNFGLVADVGKISGEWPIYSGHEYIGDVVPFVGAEITLNDGSKAHYIIEAQAPAAVMSRWEISPSGYFMGFEPVPGYFNPNQEGVAMSHLPNTWPASWPDKPESWNGYWNGYFGKGVMNADQESYFVMDDNNDREFIGKFQCDKNNPDRGGLGLEVKVRGMQWSNSLAEDCIFWLYDVTNTSTTDYDNVVFGMIVGTLCGGRGDSHDDIAYFDIYDDITYSYDKNNIGQGAIGQWSPVGVVGYAFLESPGNSTNGIDDDNDGEDNSPVVTDALLVGETPFNNKDDNGNGLVDENKFHTGYVVLGGTLTKISEPFKIKNGIDDDGDGEIGSPTVTQDMWNSATSISGTTLRKLTKNGILLLLEENKIGLKYADGIDNDGNGLVDEGIDEMIDEARNDGIDNDGDWNPQTDDVGVDGVPGTGDKGEGDGLPSADYEHKTSEPNFDITDVDESDQIGLTSFIFFPVGTTTHLPKNDESCWDELKPGEFDVVPGQAMDGDFVYASGFFPLKAGQTERFSVALVFGEPFDNNVPNNLEGRDPKTLLENSDILRNKRTVQKIYNSNYNFAQPPEKPRVTAVPGDRKVTLYWDDRSEKSIDRVSGTVDFEGYKIYRSTDPGFNEARLITDGYGTPTYDKPIAQFDLKNGIKGFFNVDPNLTVGSSFYLGSDNGIVHSYTDYGVENGQTYYYAVTAYDRGNPNPAEPLTPSENSKSIVVSGDKVLLDVNTVMVTPNAPAAGYTEAKLDGDVKQIAGFGTGKITVEIIDPMKVRDNVTYQITFNDSMPPEYTVKDTSVFIDQINIVELGRAVELKYQNIVKGTFRILSGNYTEDVDYVVDYVFGKITPLKGKAITPGTYRVSYRFLSVKDNPLSRSKVDSYDPVFDGLRLSIENDWVVKWNEKASKWNGTCTYVVNVDTALGTAVKGSPYPSSYKIEFFTNKGADTSTAISWPQIHASFKKARPVNFKITDITENKPVDFAFGDWNGDSLASINDKIILLRKKSDGASCSYTGNYCPTWVIYFSAPTSGDTIKPKDGDSYILATNKPFKSNDVFQFTTKSAYIDQSQAKFDLERVKVVPNPYVSVASWESRPYSQGRGERKIQFINLPQKATIRIYTISGYLVDTIEHNSTIDNGAETWNLLTKDGMEIAYGVYIYHVEAPGIGNKIGKFAIIK